MPLDPPVGWSISPLEREATLQRGFDLPIQEREEGEVPVYGSNGIDGWHVRAAVAGPGVITGRSGTIGSIYFETRDYWPLNTTLYVRDFHGNEPRFIARLLESLGLQRFAASTGVPSLNRNFVHPTPVLLPPPREQARIAAVLDTVDEAVARTEGVIAKLKQVRAGLLRDLLTRGLDEHGQLRDPIAHPEQFQDSSLGRIPMAWDSQTLEESCDWFSGGTPDRSHASWWRGRVPLLTPKDMKAFELSDASEHVTDEAVQAGTRLMPSETVFIVVRGMILAHTFPVCLCTRPFAFNQDIKAVRARGELTNRFLAHWFAANAAMFLRKATEATHGTKKLDTDELHRVRIGVPSAEEQEAIVERIEVLDADIDAEVATHTKLCLLKSGLMADLLIGRVRVPVLP